MNYKRLTIIGLVIFSLYCSKEISTEERIRRQIEQIREYAEQKKIGKIMDFISSDYKDKYHNKKDNIKAILLQNLLFRKNVKIIFRDIDVKLEGDIAVVDLKLFVKDGEGILPSNADFVKLKIDLLRSNSRWLITGAEWIGGQSPF